MYWEGPQLWRPDERPFALHRNGYAGMQRYGAFLILTLGPVRQWVDEPVDAPMSITVYPGSDGETTMYEDDGRTFRYRRGEWMGISLAWRDRERVLALRLSPGSRMLPPSRRRLTIQVAGSQQARDIVFTGRPLDVKLRSAGPCGARSVAQCGVRASRVGFAASSRRLVPCGLLAAALLDGAGCTGLSRVARDPSDTPRIFTATATLEQQPFEIHLAAPPRPRAPDVLVLYASGDGGWFGAAVDMFRAVGESGYYAVGLSTKTLLHRRPAEGRPLTLAELADRYRVILDAASAVLHLPSDRRVVLTGWSRGASLGVLLGDPSRAPTHLAGVIAIGLAAEENLTISSETDDDPAGPRVRRSAETLDMYPLIARIAPRRCAVIQSTGDAYLPAARARDLFGPDTGVRRFYEVKASNHRFSGGAEAFIDSLRASLQWITAPASAR